MAVYGTQGEVAVCFGEDGFFYPVVRNDLGYDDPDTSRPLKSVGDEWHDVEGGDVPHNEEHSLGVVELVPGGE